MNLLISLIAPITIIVAAYFFYRKKQKKTDFNDELEILKLELETEKDYNLLIKYKNMILGLIRENGESIKLEFLLKLAHKKIKENLPKAQ